MRKNRKTAAELEEVLRLAIPGLFHGESDSSADPPEKPPSFSLQVLKTVHEGAKTGPRIESCLRASRHWPKHSNRDEVLASISRLVSGGMLTKTWNSDEKSDIFELTEYGRSVLEKCWSSG